jgi:hypothetical protein
VPPGPPDSPPAPHGVFIAAPCLANGGHGASLRQPCGSPSSAASGSGSSSEGGTGGRHLTTPPVRAFPSSIFRDKNRCDVGKSQPQWTAKDGNAWRTVPSRLRQALVAQVEVARLAAGTATSSPEFSPPPPSNAFWPWRVCGGTHQFHENHSPYVRQRRSHLARDNSAMIRTDDEMDRIVGESQALLRFLSW